ncbi:heterokaryon incompatibility protein-domain-containing protein [Chaetomium strumarium]|uniref:Heterokaryon incompatibility protein-domain-containing protein n=1 Tax=Chaetomium strumarium TaxID=1170767 RepID=A0AAJ0GPS8_9PEZI|nr:heterokaryon incompatibility protein-domain-containing protein [Chaetomium strumarium]
MLKRAMPGSPLRRFVDVLLDAVFDHTQPSSSGPDFLWTEPNEYSQLQCRGCDEVCQLLRWGEVQRRRDKSYEGSSPSRIVHNSYLELDRCAGVSGCDTCRIFRRAFLLEQVTKRDAERLQHPDNQWPVHAVLDLDSTGGSLLSLTIRSPKRIIFSATVHLSDEPRPRAQDVTRRLAGLRCNYDELRRVIDDCRQHHNCSSNHRWSRRNPTWLLKILGNNRVQLIEGPPEPVDYVVLSYSWGDPATMPATEWARIKGAGTKTIDGRPVPERLNPFLMWELPETMQDAILLSASLGFSYLWYDNACIPKGTDWDSEASIMHEVYGNAAFTLVASSSTKATDHLIHDRLAWTHRSKACKLRGMWLHNTLLPLDRVRFQSPVSQRAWTLQEERLSPRVVYWTAQQWYWSCSERQVAEMGELQSISPPSDETPRSCPQRFLELCHTGDEEELHDEWLDVVEAYTPRDLVEPKDRFLAIAGLAVRFYNAKAVTGGTAVTEDYLAGLWKDNLARHLAWSVVSAVDPRHNLQHIAPSWSWASLPLQVHTRTKAPFRPSKHFELIAVEHVDAADAKPIPHQAATRPESASTDYVNRGRPVEERGRGVKVVEVQGRFRRFIAEDGQKVRWEAIECKRAGQRSSFDFRAFPGQHIYARHPDDGRIMSRDAHSGEVVGQLDYLVQCEHARSADQHDTAYLAEDAEKELVCLELGELAMLLLVPSQNCDQPDSYRRVGVAIAYGNRKGFFYGCDTKRIRLV